MTNERERLEDDFTRAEGAQEIAFRAYLKAKRANAAVLMKAFLVKGECAYADLRRLASKLATLKRK